LFRPLPMSSPTKLAPFLTIATCSGVRRRLHRCHSFHVTVVSASQVAMAAVAGVVLFGEVPTGPLVAGVLLTVLGAVLIHSRAA